MYNFLQCLSGIQVKAGREIEWAESNVPAQSENIVGDCGWYCYSSDMCKEKQKHNHVSDDWECQWRLWLNSQQELQDEIYITKTNASIRLY